MMTDNYRNCCNITSQQLLLILMLSSSHQSVLVGKAREAYSSLSVEQSSDYEIVKHEILRAYELVP